jgi:hypothetical protein
MLPVSLHRATQPDGVAGAVSFTYPDEHRPPRRPLTRIVLDIQGRDIHAVAVEERTI